MIIHYNCTIGSFLLHSFLLIYHPACAVGLQLSVCLSVCLSVYLSVCLSVDAYSGTTGYEAAYELYKRVQIYKDLKNYKAILLKQLRLGDMA